MNKPWSESPAEEYRRECSQLAQEMRRKIKALAEEASKAANGPARHGNAESAFDRCADKLDQARDELFDLENDPAAIERSSV